MAAKLDLSKQIGPLPLGAWVVVVGTGLGIAYYSKRGSSDEPVPMRDISGDPGVGTGPGWTAIAPPTDAPQGSPDIEDREPQTNEEWARVSTNYLIAQGYDPATADAALRKYLVAGKLSIKEHALLSIAMAKYGAPPVALPPAPDPEQIAEPTPEPAPKPTPRPRPRPAPRPTPPTSVPSPVRAPKPPPRPKPAPPKPRAKVYTAQGKIGNKTFNYSSTNLNTLKSQLEAWVYSNRMLIKHNKGQPMFPITSTNSDTVSGTNVSNRWIKGVLDKKSIDLIRTGKYHW